MPIILFLLASAATLSEASLIRANLFTPLKNDDHPCVAENLKETHRYICNDEKDVICLDGYREPNDHDERDLKNPCPVPICEYDDGSENKKTCAHGECVRPDVCACEVGWEGHLCDRCVPLPGCEHGSCVDAFQCNCNEGDVEEDGGTTVKKPFWEGAFCDKPACPPTVCNPKHGSCYEPRMCTCNDGWSGSNCMECKTLHGCMNGKCENLTNTDGDGEMKPHTCECEEGWKGPLCNEPICTKGCQGRCYEPDTCVCDVGWEGERCDQCVAYYSCPKEGTCHEPNQCFCSDEVADDKGVCNKEYINGPMKSKKPECKNPCQKNEVIESHFKEEEQKKWFKKSKCRWGDASKCQDDEAIEGPCYGDKEWWEGDENDWASCQALGSFFHVKEGKPDMPETVEK